MTARLAILVGAVVALQGCDRSPAPRAPATAPVRSGAPAASTPAFVPSRNGFAFANNFPGAPLPTFLNSGSAADGKSGFGLCGGMTAAAADYFLSGELPPRMRERPQRGSTLYEYFFLRQAESIGPGLATASKFAAWTGKTDSELARLTETEIGALETRLRTRAVVPIGLILARPGGPAGRRDVWDNHQVLALGVERSNAGTTVRVYDPNFPDDDSVRIELRGAMTGGSIGVRRRARDEAGTEVRGFFLVPYEMKSPPKSDSP